MHQILNRFNTLVNSQSVPEVGSAVKQINENTMPHTRATTRSPDVKKSTVPAFLRKNRKEPQLTLTDLEKEKPRSAVKENRGSSIDDIVAQYQSDITQFKNTGELSDALYSALYDYYTDNGEMPYGTAKARDGDPYQWIGNQLGQELNEAAKWRDPKYKDKLYTQEPRDYDQYDYGDSDYYNPKPADYPGEKNLKGGGEFSHNDPLQKGQGIGRSGIKHSILDRGPRKGLPSRNQITSLKGSIKDAHGTHAQPNLPEAAGAVNFDKVLNAIAALYGDDMWHNDSMQDVAHDLEQQNPTDQELDFIIAKGRLPKRLANTQFSAGDGVQFGEGSSPMTPKQKSFAKLAPPTDKITFADKIAGAKKEVDEMLGDVAAEAMRGALSGGQKKLDKNKNGKLDAMDFEILRKGGKKATDEAEDNSPFTAHKRPREEMPRAGTVTHGAKHDTEWTSTGRKVTRRVNPDGTSAGAEDDSASAVKRSAGAPKKHINPRQERVTAKSRKQDRTAHGQTGFAKGKKVKEQDDMFLGNKSDEYDREGKMAKQELSTATRAVRELQSIIDSDENLPEWVQAKITKAVDYLDTSSDYMKSKDDNSNSGEKELGEKATSKKQQKFMGMVHAAQKGEKPASKEVGKVAKTMKKSDAEDFASTKHKGLPEKKKPEAKKEKSVEENTVAGSIAPSAGPAKDSGAPKKEKASGGAMQFGKGVYEGRLNKELNSKVEKIINEGFSVSTNVGEDGKQSITINATDEDAAKLVEMLKLAGLTNSSSYGDACPQCGQSGCGCSQVAEDYANSPEPHESDSITMLKTLSGGLNGMKSTGQSTGAIPNLDPRRQVTMSETAATVVKENETRLWDIYQARR